MLRSLPIAISLAFCVVTGCLQADPSHDAAYASGTNGQPSSGPSTQSDCANPKVPSSILVGSSDASADSSRQANSAAAAAVALADAPLMTVTAQAPRAQLSLAVANDQSSREFGLMCVLRIKPQHGMIFVFGRDASQEFWMKNTLVPLDMVWVHSDGTVDTVAASVPASTRDTPDDRIARRTGAGRFVIELSAGEAAQDGLARGARIKLPSSDRADFGVKT